MKNILLFLALLLLITFNSFSQSIEQKDSLNNKLMNVAREIYGSNKALLNSLKDLLLEKEQAADLDEIPSP